MNLTFFEVQNKRLHSFQWPILKKRKAGSFTCSAALETNTKASCCHDFILKNNTCERQVNTWVIKGKMADTISCKNYIKQLRKTILFPTYISPNANLESFPIVLILFLFQSLLGTRSTTSFFIANKWFQRISEGSNSLATYMLQVHSFHNLNIQRILSAAPCAALTMCFYVCSNWCQTQQHKQRRWWVTAHLRLGTNVETIKCSVQLEWYSELWTDFDTDLCFCSQWKISLIVAACPQLSP